MRAAQLISEKIDRSGGFEAGFQWCCDELREAGYIKLANEVGRSCVLARRSIGTTTAAPPKAPVQCARLRTRRDSHAFPNARRATEALTYVSATYGTTCTYRSP